MSFPFVLEPENVIQLSTRCKLSFRLILEHAHPVSMLLMEIIVKLELSSPFYVSPSSLKVQSHSGLSLQF